MCIATNTEQSAAQTAKPVNSNNTNDESFDNISMKEQNVPLIALYCIGVKVS